MIGLKAFIRKKIMKSTLPIFLQNNIYYNEYITLVMYKTRNLRKSLENRNAQRWKVSHGLDKK